MRRNEKYLMKFYEDANDTDKIKSLLLSKKELAIEEVLALLPFVNPDEMEVKIVYLRILPVFFSYVSLYDMRVTEVLKIVDILRVHPAFVDYQNIFEQWFTVFDRRRESKKRFSYKDETYVRCLPQIKPSSSQNDLFHNCIGYANVPLLRAFHRWLRLHRLHKYLFFVANLSYDEVLQMGESQIDFFAEQMDIMKVTIGAKNKIAREIEMLRTRQNSLESIIEAKLTTAQEVEVAIREIKKILRTPICVNHKVNENVPSLLVNALNKEAVAPSFSDNDVLVPIKRPMVMALRNQSNENIRLPAKYEDILVFNVVHVHLGTGENVIPVYGLLISVLKEAWNYAIFSPLDKELFNQWRRLLSDNLNTNSCERDLRISRDSEQAPLHSPIQSCNLISFDSLAVPDGSLTFGPSFYQCLEDVATSSAEYVLW